MSLEAQLRRLEKLVRQLQGAETDWIDLPLSAPWVQYGAVGNFRAQYRRYRGLGHVRGLVKNTVAYSYAGAGSNLTIAVLPDGFRPDDYVMGEGYQLDTTPSKSILRLNLDPAGAISIHQQGDWLNNPSNNGVASWIKLTFPPFIPVPS